MMNRYAFVVYGADGEWKYDTRRAVDWMRFPANIAVIAGRGKGRTSLLQHIAMHVWVPVMVYSNLPFEITIVTSERGPLEQALRKSAASYVAILDADTQQDREDAFRSLEERGNRWRQASSAAPDVVAMQRLVIVDVMGMLSAGEESVLSKVAKLPASANCTLLVGSMLPLEEVAGTLLREMHLVCERRAPLTTPLMFAPDFRGERDEQHNADYNWCRDFLQKQGGTSGECQIRDQKGDDAALDALEEDDDAALEDDDGEEVKLEDAFAFRVQCTALLDEWVNVPVVKNPCAESSDDGNGENGGDTLLQLKILKTTKYQQWSRRFNDWWYKTMVQVSTPYVAPSTCYYTYADNDEKEEESATMPPHWRPPSILADFDFQWGPNFEWEESIEEGGEDDREWTWFTLSSQWWGWLHSFLDA